MESPAIDFSRDLGACPRGTLTGQLPHPAFGFSPQPRGLPEVAEKKEKVSLVANQ